MSAKIALRQSSGFTLIEVLIAVPTILLILSGLIVLFSNMLNSSNIFNSRLMTAVNSRSAINTMQADISLATDFLPTIDSNRDISDPYGPNNSGGTWSYRSNSGVKPGRLGGFIDQPNVLIIRSYASTASTADPNKSLVFLNTNGCTSGIVASNPVLPINNIYFVRNNTLYRRTLMPNPLPTNLCAQPFQRQTCPTDVANPRNSLCKANDTVLANNVNYFEVQYATSDLYSDMSDVYDAGKEDNLQLAKRVVIKVGTTENASGKVNASLSIVTIYKRN